ncbi:hypothetical protein Tco_0490094 [Tanacetum coccineum]
MEQPNWDASDYPFKEDYTIIFKPRAVIYRDRDDNRKMMRIDEVHKFSDRTLTKIKDKLDFMVKDFKLFKFNKGMENRKLTEDDKIRGEDFIETDQQNRVTRFFLKIEMEMEFPYTIGISDYRYASDTTTLVMIVMKDLKRCQSMPKLLISFLYFTSDKMGPLQDDVRFMFG